MGMMRRIQASKRHASDEASPPWRFMCEATHSFIHIIVILLYLYIYIVYNYIKSYQVFISALCSILNVTLHGVEKIQSNLGSWQMRAQEMCDGGIGEEERLSADFRERVIIRYCKAKT